MRLSNRSTFGSLKIDPVHVWFRCRTAAADFELWGDPEAAAESLEAKNGILPKMG